LKDAYNTHGAELRSASNHDDGEISMTHALSEGLHFESSILKNEGGISGSELFVWGYAGLVWYQG